MRYDKHKYIGFLGLLSIIGLKGFITGNHLWFLLFINYAWFIICIVKDVFYERRL